MSKSRTTFAHIVIAILINFSWTVTSAQAAFPLETSSANMLTRKGYALMQSGSYTGAALILKNAIRLNPNDLSARRYLVYSLIRLGSLQDAATQLQTISKATTLTAFDYFMSGCIEVRLGKNDQALKQYRAALDLEPDMAAAKAGIIELFVLASDFQSATFLCQDCLAKSRNPAELQYFRQLFNSVQERQRIELANQSVEDAKAKADVAVQSTAQNVNAALVAPKSLIPLVIQAPVLAPPKLAPIATRAKA